MQVLFSICLLLAFLPQTTPFVMPQWVSYTPPDIAGRRIVGSWIDNTEPGVILYIFMLSFDNVSLAIQKTNMSTPTPTMLSFTQTIQLLAPVTSPPLVTFFTNTFLISYATSASTSQFMILTKSALAIPSQGSQTYVKAGVYLPLQDYVFYRNSPSENLIYNPEGANSQIGAYSSGTANHLTIKYLYTASQTKMFTLYTDKNFFLIRTVGSLASMTLNYMMSTQISLPEPGVQACCLSPNTTLLFILLPSGSLRVFNTATQAFTQTVSVGLTGMNDCFFDETQQVLAFVQSTFTNLDSGSTLIKYFSLPSSSLLGSTQTSEMYFTKPDNVALKYATTSTGTTVNVYGLISTNCLSNQYYNFTLATCATCPIECTACTNSQTCTNCTIGYSLDVTNNCVVTASAANITNSTLNITSNSTLNSTSNGTLNDTLMAPSSAIYESLLEILMNNTIIRILNKVPGGRKALPFLCFLLDLDQIWLYQYHERDYGENINLFFLAIKTLQQEKWKLLGDNLLTQIYWALQTSTSAINEIIDSKRNYTHPAFLSAEDAGETFLPACWNFLTFNLLFVLAAFALLRWGFRLLFHYRVSIFLRPFSFLIYLSPLLLDGNLQYFFFVMFSQSYLGFSLSPKDKLLTVLSYLLSFLVIWLGVVSCFLAYYFSRKLSKYILDNWRSRIHGLFGYSFSNVVRMVVFAAIHNFLRFDYDLQLKLLMTAEGCYVFFVVYAMRTWKAHKEQLKFWFGIIFAGLRMVLQGTLWLQQYSSVVGTETKEYYLFQAILASLVVLYVVTFYVAVAIQLVASTIDAFRCKPSKNLQPQTTTSKHVKTPKETKVTTSKQKDMPATWSSKMSGCTKKSLNSLKTSTKLKKKKTIAQNKIVRFENQRSVMQQNVIIQQKSQRKGFQWKVIERVYA